jgi:hypothetical protein
MQTPRTFVPSSSGTVVELTGELEDLADEELPGLSEDELFLSPDEELSVFCDEELAAGVEEELMASPPLYQTPFLHSYAETLLRTYT